MFIGIELKMTILDTLPEVFTWTGMEGMGSQLLKMTNVKRNASGKKKMKE